MKKFLLSLAVILFITNATAQNTTKTFAKGDNVVGLGFGVGGVYGFNAYHSQSPTFGLQYDRAIIELKMGGVIGAGGFVGYKTIAYRDAFGTNYYKQRWNIVIVGARGTFHYDLFKVNNLDTYGGAMVAVHIINHTENYPDGYGYSKNSHGNAAYASLFAGAKYYFTPAFGVFGEVGYGVSWLTLGIALKF